MYNIIQISVVVMISNIKKIVFQSPGLENEHFIQLSENFTNKTHTETFRQYIFVSIHIWLSDFYFKSNISLHNIVILILIFSHNNNVILQLLERTMKVECKCHGVSGSCELKTCWRSLASFRMVSFTNYPPPPHRPPRSDWPTFNFCPAWKAQLVSVLLSPH